VTRYGAPDKRRLLDLGMIARHKAVRCSPRGSGCRPMIEASVGVGPGRRELSNVGAIMNGADGEIGLRAAYFMTD